MTLKKIIFLVLALFLFSQVRATSLGQNPPSEHSVRAIDSVFLSNLLADGIKSWPLLYQHQIELEKKEQEKALHAPAIELYGENSWGNYVNPFAGRKVSIPRNYKIDCSGLVMPLDKPIHITSHFGYRRRFRRMHKGVDIALRMGDTIRAIFDGKVRIRNYNRRGYGNYVVLRHPNGLETIYGHMSRHLVKLDQVVHAGDPIGLGGSTGRSTGPHLHLELRFMGVEINPSQVINFRERVPQRDIYVFRRGNTSSNAFTYSNASRYNDQPKSSSTYISKGHSKQRRRRHNSYYRVRRGDSLWTISKKTGVSVTQLCRLNRMRKNAVIRPGRTIRIR